MVYYSMSKTRFDQSAKAIVIEELTKHGEPALAAKVVGFSLKTIQQHGRRDEEFAQAIYEALQHYRATIAREIHRRAIDGWDEPVYQGGHLVGTKRKFSDALLALHAKRHMPEEYGDKKTVTHNNQGSIDVASMTPEARALLRKLLEIEAPDDGC